jgi:hypothetical protein
LARKQIIRDLKKHRLPHLLPNVKKMPIGAFQGIQFLSKGFDEHEKFVLKETVLLLGGTFIDWKMRAELSPDKSVYVLCAELTKTKNLIEGDEVLQRSSVSVQDIKVKRSVWLFKCQFKGELLD